MPGWAGSSFYWMRYMDALNEKSLQKALAGKALIYTLAVTNMQLDIYCIPFWNKFLKDKGFAPTEEPSKKSDDQEEMPCV
jgi:leucyl-tRNA synthetase